MWRLGLGLIKLGCVEEGGQMMELEKKFTLNSPVLLSGSQASDSCGQDVGSGSLTLWTI